MKKLYLLIIASFLTVSVVAQKNAPKWLEKQRKAIVSITTYGTDNNKLYSGTGFFVNETGEVISAYSLFKGASKATVTDSEGKSYQVESILGADDMYDVIKVKVNVPKKVSYLPIAREPLATETVVYLVPYTTGKNAAFKEGKITEVTKLKDSYSYYQASIPMETSFMNAPLFTVTGEVFGLAQEDATGKKEILYAVSAGYAATLTLSTTDAFNTIYNSIGIKKAWNENPEQALVALYLLSSTQEPKTYLETLNDFIMTFPNEAEGYYNRASHYVYNREVLGSSPSEKANYLALASNDLDTYLRLNTKKGNALYNKAKLVYGVAVSDTMIADEKWTLKSALNVV